MYIASPGGGVRKREFGRDLEFMTKILRKLASYYRPYMPLFLVDMFFAVTGAGVTRQTVIPSALSFRAPCHSELAEESRPVIPSLPRNPFRTQKNADGNRRHSFLFAIARQKIVQRLIVFAQIFARQRIHAERV